jgi:hypothetical protein
VKHPVGFYVSGQGRVVKGSNDTALVRDENGGEHVVTTVRSTAGSGNSGHIVYLTRKAGATKWTSHAIPGLRPMAGGIKVEIHTSFYGDRVFAVFYQCNGVYVSDATLSQSRLPTPTLVEAESNCASPVKAPAGPTSDAVALPYGGDEVAVLLPDPANSNQPSLFTGTPGGTFTASDPLPTTDSLAPVRMTIDSVTGLITVVSNGSDGTHAGIYVTNKPYYTSTWSTPTRIATLSRATQDFTVGSVTAYNGAIWVGLQEPNLTGLHRTHALFVQHGTASNQWIGVVPLAHATLKDTDLQLAFNAQTGHLHAAFSRVNPASKTKKSGIITEARVSGKWVDLKFLTHWYKDRTTQITYTNAGHAVIGYQES